MRHDQKAIGLQCFLVLDHAILWDADAEEGRTECTETANNERAFQGAEHHRGEVAQHHDVPNNRNGEQYSAEKQTPDPAPHCTVRAPELHSVPSVVEPDHFFFGVITLADDTEMFHIEPGIDQLADGGFSFSAMGENGNDCVMM